MNKQFVLTVRDQGGNIVSLDTINTDDILRTKYIVSKRTMLVVLKEPFSEESYQQVPVPNANKKITTPNFESRKVKREGYYAQGITDPTEIQELYNLLTDNAPLTVFPGFAISDEYEKAYEAYKAEQEQAQAQGLPVNGEDKEMLSEKEEAIIKNIKEKVVN